MPFFFSGGVLVFSYFAELFASKIISVHILWVALSSPLPLVLLGMCMKVYTIVSLWFSKILFLSHMYGFSADQILNTLRLYIPYFSKIFLQYGNLFFPWDPSWYLFLHAFPMPSSLCRSHPWFVVLFLMISIACSQPLSENNKLKSS